MELLALKQRALVWALNFAFNRKLKELGGPERESLYTDIRANISDDDERMPVDPGYRGQASTPGVMERLQGRLRAILGGILPLLSAREPQLSVPLPPPPPGFYDQRTLHVSELTTPGKFLEIYRSNSHAELVQILPGGRRGKVIIRKPGAPEKLAIYPTLWPTANLEDFVVERFVSILSMPVGIPVGSICQCEGCGQWFSHRKRKRFCLPKCNRDHNARLRRGEPGSEARKAYNERQAILMKRRYREKKGGQPLNESTLQ
jgi:hypothetical protein